MYYTKYRPQKFSEILKPNDTAEALSKQILSGKTVHAYLFVGPRGTGKTTTARILAKALNCSSLEKNGDPCNKCDSCKAIKKGSFTDLIEIDAASNRGIDDIRDLKERIKLAPGVGSRKVYIIDEVHMLTPEAFNALLKTLEEPPAKVVLILCTTELHKVPETIRSRCQTFKFKRATLNQIIEKLKFISEQENAKISEKDLKHIAAAAYGGFRDAETLLQQVVEGEIPAESLTSMGTIEDYSEFFQFLLEKDTKAALKEIDSLYERGNDLYVWSGELIKYLRDLLFVKVSVYEPVEELSEELSKKMSNQAKKIESHEIVRILELLNKAQSEVRNSFITQLPLEMFVVSVCDSGENREKTFSPKVSLGPEDSQEGKYFPRLAKKVKDENLSKKESTRIEVTSKTTETSKIEIEQAGESQIVEIQNETTEIVSFESVNNNWKTVIKEVSSVNNSISALLKAATLVDVEGKWVKMEVPFDFHKERLESNKNRKIIENALSNILEKELAIKCMVKKHPSRKLSEKETGKLTDLNLVSSSIAKGDKPEDIMDMFDGGLPM